MFNRHSQFPNPLWTDPGGMGLAVKLDPRKSGFGGCFENFMTQESSRVQGPLQGPCLGVHFDW